MHLNWPARLPERNGPPELRASPPEKNGLINKRRAYRKSLHYRGDKIRLVHLYNVVFSLFLRSRLIIFRFRVYNYLANFVRYMLRIERFH